MKRILALILASFMLLALVACDTDDAAVNGVDNTQVESGKKEEAPKEEKKNYPDNILINPLGSGGYVFFNRDVSNDSIETITFLDTLADMPEDAWDVSEAKDKSVMAWVTNGVDLYIAGEGGVTASTCKGLFSHYANLVSIDFGGCFYTDLTDRFIEMFAYCENLETLDLSGWNTSNVRYMSAVFYDCFNLKTVNLSGWDTSNVESMNMMFDGCQYLESVDVSHFDTSKVVDFREMFSFCKRLKSLDLSNWDTSSAKSMSEMFYYCKEISTIGDLKVPEGCDTTDMFADTSLK